MLSLFSLILLISNVVFSRVPNIIWLMGSMVPFMMMSLFNPSTIFMAESFLFMKDAFGSWFIVLTWWILILMLMCSSFSVFKKSVFSSSFIKLVLLLGILLVLAFSLENVFLFYVSFELTLIPTVMLILWWGYQPERVEAAMFMIMYTMVASLFFLLFLITSWASGMTSFMEDGFGVFSWGMIICGVMAFLVKLPMYGFHVWLPKAHVEAPVAGSMILAAVLLKLGVYGLTRVMMTWQFSNWGFISGVVSFSIVGGLVTCVLCMRSVDMKKMIAYSSVGHMSLIVPSLFSQSSWGVVSALMIAVSHGFSSSCMFFFANVIYEKSSTRSLVMNKGLLGLYPALVVMIMITCAVNMSVPPTINFLGEVLSYSVFISYSYFMTFLLMMIGLLTGSFSAYLYLSLIHGNTPIGVGVAVDSRMNLLAFFMHLAPSFLFIIVSDLFIFYY